MVKYGYDRSGVIGGNVPGHDESDYPEDDYYSAEVMRSPVISQNRERIPQADANAERIRHSLMGQVDVLMESVVRLRDPKITLNAEQVVRTGSAPLLLGGLSIAQARIVKIAPGERIGNKELGLPPENPRLPSSELYVSLGTEYRGDLYPWTNDLELDNMPGIAKIGDAERHDAIMRAEHSRVMSGEIRSPLVSVATMGYFNGAGEPTNYGTSFGANRAFCYPKHRSGRDEKGYGLLIRTDRPDPRSSSSDYVGYYQAFYASVPHDAITSGL